MRVLGVIPARAGSKSIPNKCIAPVCGKPLISYTFECAKKAKALDRVVITTDCVQCANLAEKFEIQRIARPAKLAQDDTPMITVIQHALSVVGEVWDAVMILQPTCPLRTHFLIDTAVGVMRMSDEPDSVISYVPVGANHPTRMVHIRRGLPERISPDAWSQKQDLLPAYLRSGDIYLTRTDWINKGSVAGDYSVPMLIEREFWCNIDEPLDLEWAEFLLTRQMRRAVDERLSAGVMSRNEARARMQCG